MKKLLLLIMLTFPLNAYKFSGEHYIASFHGCENLFDNQYVYQSFIGAVWLSGAKLCDAIKFEFKPCGITIACILLESHATIHTYPEHRSLYIDMFTCGEKSFWEKFESLLIEAFKPQSIESRVIKR